jgi:hypothetical protein
MYAFSSVAILKKFSIFTKKEEVMKKALVIILACGFLFASLAFAEGGKNQGENGQGTTTTTRDPAPIDWPGIDWD